MIIKSAIELEQFECWDCGVVFAVPRQWIRNKMKEDESIKCPNGHDFAIEWKDGEEKLETDNKALKTEVAALKLRLFQALHDAEQSEARGVEPVQSSPTSPESSSGPLQVKVDHTRIYCPYCRASFKRVEGLVLHCKKYHQKTTEDLQVINRAANVAISRFNQGT